MFTPVVGVLFDNLVNQEIHGLNKLLQKCNTSVVKCRPSDRHKNMDSTTSIYYITVNGDKPSKYNPVIATLQSCNFNYHGTVNVEIVNLCLAPNLNTSNFTELINSLLTKLRQDLDEYVIESYWVGVDLDVPNYQFFVYALASQNFIVDGIVDQRPSAGNSTKIAKIGMVLNYKNGLIESNGEIESIDFLSAQVNLAHNLLSEYNTRVVNCIKLVKMSSNLCKELLNLLKEHDSEVSNFFYLHFKQKSNIHESIYHLAADLKGHNTDLIISPPKECNVDFPDDLSKKVYFHTHPSTCYQGITQIGWPSTLDFMNAFYCFVQEDHLAHIIIALGGIYILRPQHNLKSNILPILPHLDDLCAFRDQFFLYLQSLNLDLERGFEYHSHEELFNTDTIKQANSELFIGLNHPRVNKMAMHIQEIKFQTIEKFYQESADHKKLRNHDEIGDFGLISVEYKSHTEIQENGGYEFTVYGDDGEEQNQCVVWEVDQIPNDKEIAF
jgi:predicted Zn-ribbon and HTH transcriptional regulator